MISQYFFKDKLEEISSRIKEIRLFTEYNENYYSELEFSIISGFFIIRKLKEHYKLTNDFISTKIKKGCYKYPFIEGKIITPINNYNWGEFYDFKNRKNEKFTIEFLCNKFIHSYYFIPYENIIDDKGNIIEEWDEDEMNKYNKRYDFVLFNSDDDKEKYLYEIEIDEILNIFKKVYSMDISSTEMKCTENGTWKIKNSDKINIITPELEEIVNSKELE